MSSSPTAQRPATLFARLRGRYRWFDHVVRAVTHYVDYHGYHYAASITYFSVLSMVPILMVALAVASFVLAGQPELMNDMRVAVANAIPNTLDKAANDLVDNVVDHRLRLGVFGLLLAGYSGWNWMNALRDALTAMWDQERPAQAIVPMVLKDLLALLSLAAALLVSFALTASGGLLGDLVLGISDTSWVHVLLSITSVPLALLADWLVFVWVLSRLPRQPVSFRSAFVGAAIAAVGFELLKQVGNVYLQALGRSPTGVTFGSLIGLLVFVYLVSRLLMLAAAWTVTGQPAEPPPPPGPVGIGTVLQVRESPSLPAAAGLIGVGALGTLLLQRILQKR